MKNILLILTTLMLLVSCTENQRVKHYGGTQTIKINKKRNI